MVNDIIYKIIKNNYTFDDIYNYVKCNNFLTFLKEIIFKFNVNKYRLHSNKNIECLRIIYNIFDELVFYNIVIKYNEDDFLYFIFRFIDEYNKRYKE